MSQASSTQDRIGWHILRIVIGSVFLLAAAAKFYEYCFGSPVGGNWSVILLIEAEWLGSLILLFGILPRVSWLAALVTLGMFSVISLKNGLAGEETCGCFGHWKVNPFVTSALDATLVAGLLFWRPTKRHDPRIFWSWRPVLIVLTVIWLSIGLPAAYAMSNRLETAISDLGEQTSDGKLVVLQPDKWIGKRFPLLDYINIEADLGKGEWLVLIYQRSCSKCQEKLRDLPVLANGSRIALIEMSPDVEPNDEAVAVTCGAVLGRLSTSREWYEREPIVIRLADGLVLE